MTSTLLRNRHIVAAALAFIASSLAQAQTQTEFPATLAGHAFIPAPSFIATPADAPADLRFSA